MGNSSLGGPALVDAAKDFFGVGDGVDDGTDGGGDFFESFKLSQLACGQDGGGDEQDAFAAFVHGGKNSMFAICSLEEDLAAGYWKRPGFENREGWGSKIPPTGY